MERYRGRCLCGAVTYEVTRPLKFVAHDHCSICRRATGAAFVTWCGVISEEQQFELTSGKSDLSVFKSTPETERQFCKKCGTHLFFRSKRWPDEIHFTRASIEDQIEELPVGHVYFSEKVDWLDVKDDLPRYGGKSGMEPM